jgi:hypothetical protein
MTDAGEKSLHDDIAPKTVAHEAPAPEKEFKGWHKPRKQWVRSEQWRKETEALIPNLTLDGRPLRYLSLPGEDMLDIRVLVALCGEKNLRLKCLGFDESRREPATQTEINISRNEVSENIELDSIICADNISVLTNTNSQGFKYVRERGPFDVINLDLCGSISCINYPDNHQVVKNLCEYQVNHSSEPWLLFLTTRAEYAEVNLEHLPRYLGCLKVNANSVPSFGGRLAEITGLDIQEFHGKTDLEELLAECEDERFVKLFAVGFGKWLLRLMIEADSVWKVEMLDSCWYRVEDNQSPESYPNMLSLAFLLSPVPIALADTSGLTEGSPEPQIDENRLALEVLDRTDDFIDLDMMLDKDESLYRRFENQSASLLKGARYPDEEQYSEWAEKKRIHFEN